MPPNPLFRFMGNVWACLLDPNAAAALGDLLENSRCTSSSCISTQEQEQQQGHLLRARLQPRVWQLLLHLLAWGRAGGLTESRFNRWHGACRGGKIDLTRAASEYCGMGV